MVNKFVSLSTLLFVTIVLLVAHLSPNNPMFLFIASSKWLSLARIALVGSMIWLSFRGNIPNLRLRKHLNIGGKILMAVGGLMLVAIQLDGYLFDYFKPLDMLLLIETGVIFSLSSMTETPATVAKAPKQTTAKAT